MLERQEQKCKKQCLPRTCNDKRIPCGLKADEHRRHERNVALAECWQVTALRKNKTLEPPERRARSAICDPRSQRFPCSGRRTPVDNLCRLSSVACRGRSSVSRRVRCASRTGRLVRTDFFCSPRRPRDPSGQTVYYMAVKVIGGNAPMDVSTLRRISPSSPVNFTHREVPVG